METYQTYRGIGIRYTTLGGTTYVEDMGFPLKTFPGLGSLEGERVAKAWIDAFLC